MIKAKKINDLSPELNSPSKFPQTFGGSSGNEFDDTTGKSIVGIQSISIYGGAWIDSIKVTYLLSNGETFPADRRGGSGGTESILNLEPGEVIISISGSTGAYVNSLLFKIRKVDGTIRESGTFGNLHDTPFTVNGMVLGFFGRCDTALVQFGIYINYPVTSMYGGSGGSCFSDEVLTHIPAVTGINEMTITYGDYISSITTIYNCSDGTTYAPDTHGSEGVNSKTISFAEGERITGVVGRADRYVDQLSFFTIDNRKKRRIYGPFGGNGGNLFLLNENNVGGFFGRDAELLDAIGFYTQGPGFGQKQMIQLGTNPALDFVDYGDHTFLAVMGDRSKEYPNNVNIFFDAAGGHGDPDGHTAIPIEMGTLITHGKPEDLIRMATGGPIAKLNINPLKTVYGNTDEFGTGTAGIDATGGWNRGGFCHQIVNRLLYACNPTKILTLADANPVPSLYWASVQWTGVYGRANANIKTNFVEWCAQCDFPAPPSEDTALYNDLKQFEHRHRILIVRHMIELQEAFDLNPSMGDEERNELKARFDKNILSDVPKDLLDSMGILSS